ncbi:DUF2845 domain-containing protein [Variovorax guangxiensis]|uniref:DUF2845 domain-containing protein n=1 Tax=Variovorax guangxiensis TaxID=1775474 RepID=A0A433MTS8_9BURK|nr:DUF2845 domain-containing protein [Variovorax guangxiensis]RUR71291.1 DUF2845 domain-containing protein [Variovorax guangxiensis]
MDILVGLIVCVVLFSAGGAWIKSEARKRRRAALLEKYGDPEIVEGIMSCRFWQGQTEEQLNDSLGRPADVESRVMKTKHRQIWKYHPAGKNRYLLRVTLENGAVVGWEQK